ncbi:MAG TPA: hypothetical protein VFK86_00135 [Bauldia sp.]|nr:hypothetical protein [Bauldia sp.]
MPQPQPFPTVSGTARRSGRGSDHVEGFEKELEFLQQRKGEKVDIANRTLGPDSQPYLRAKALYDDAMRGVEIARIKVRNREPKRRHLNPFVYAAFAVLFIGLEAPINKFVFDVAFGSLAIYSWGGAITLGMVLLLVSHFDGVALRHVWSESDRRIYVGKVVQFLFLTAFLIVAVLALAVARYQFSIIGTSLDLGALVGNLDNVQTIDDIVSLISLALSDSSARLLAVANGGAILVAIFVAMVVHDPDENYDAALRKLDRMERMIKRLDAKYKKALDRINSEYEPEIARLNDAIAAAMQRSMEPAAANQNA